MSESIEDVNVGKKCRFKDTLVILTILNLCISERKYSVLQYK